uniref:cation-translocating P-type ATPase C-terminal domain-containing protein n=1 Tax=Roseburia sp. TaxID=2049040 RepID=UPI003FF10299
TDSLPALALGVDIEEQKNFMDRPPRGKDESLFAGGGWSCTCFYGVLIAAISTVAFLQLPVELLLKEQLPVTLSAIKALLEQPELLSRSQTYAFTVLGMAQLFHAVGMRDVETSLFRMNHLENKLMILAVIVGLGLQLLVTEVPYFVTLFGTCGLSFAEWAKLLLLAAMPLLAHELLIAASVLFGGERERTKRELEQPKEEENARWH